MIAQTVKSIGSICRLATQSNEPICSTVSCWPDNELSQCASWIDSSATGGLLERKRLTVLA